MIRFIKIISLFAIAIFSHGCLVFQSVSYEINLDNETSGTVKMKVEDIRSDAMNSSELEEDKLQLFHFILKSDEFIEQMKDEGKNITDRQLFIEEEKLYGSAEYSFVDISNTESVVKFVWSLNSK